MLARVRVLVFVDGWQQECCGAAFSVGDDIAWQLVVDHGFRRVTLDRAAAESGAAGAALNAALELPVLELLGPASADWRGAVLGAGALRVLLPADVGPPPTPRSPVPDPPDPCPVPLLAEDHHTYSSPRVPPTPGRVASIRVVRGHRSAAGRLPGQPTLRYIHAVGRGHQLDRDGTVLSGYLVELDVALR